MATWIVGGILLLIVIAILRKMLTDRRHGKSACGCDCAHCHGGCSAQPK